MKKFIIAAIAVAGTAVAAPAFAQTAEPTITSPQAYVNLGYTYLNPYQRDLGEVTGRVGLRMGKYWGVEGEIGGGVVGNNYTDANGNHVNLSEGVSGAGYVVGYYPIMQGKVDLLARIGYGGTPLTLKTPTGDLTHTTDSINYGAGAQYMLDQKNGVRFDYTRRDYQEGGALAPKDGDTYALAYVHKF